MGLTATAGPPVHRYPSVADRRVPARGAAARLIAIVAAIAVLGVAGPGADPAWAAWSIGLTSSQALAQAGQAPPAPGSVSAKCGGLVGNSITVSWAAVSRATSYAVYQSTTSASSGYGSTPAGTVTAPTTSWSTPALTSVGTTYWFEVAAYIGTYWNSPHSAATAGHTILIGLLCS